VDLTLPTVATGIVLRVAEYPNLDPTFKYFSGLTTVSDAGILDIGAVAFRAAAGSSGSAGLANADFPQAAGIGEMAFGYCKTWPALPSAQRRRRWESTYSTA
jgi:hypothetical protein